MQICLQKTQPYVYALKPPSEVKCFLIKKSMSLVETFTLEHGIESCFECLILSRKVQDHSTEFLRNKNNINKNISRKCHWLQ